MLAIALWIIRVKGILIMNWETFGEFLLFFIGLIILGSLSSRLLGVRLSWRQRLFASFLGTILGGILTALLWYRNPGLSIPLVGVASTVFATMVIAVLMELLARPGRLVNVESRLIQ